jgi:lipoprotein NlpI
VELDHQYLEAWTQIGCVHSELGELPAALDAFNIALGVHPDYPDAHLHRAEALHQLGRTDEAVASWTAYLQFDSRGPWADMARQRLEELP